MKQHRFSSLWASLFTFHFTILFYQTKRWGYASSCWMPSARKKGHAQTVAEVGRPFGVCLSMVIAGHPFIIAIYSLMKKVKKPEHKVRTACLAREDIRIWSSFLTSFNGRFSSNNRVLTLTRMFTSAWLHSTSAGFSGCFQKEWIYGGWSGSWLGKDILVLEDYAVVVAVATCGQSLHNKVETLYSMISGVHEIRSCYMRIMVK